MARPRQSGLTENELAIMRLLWERSPQTVWDLLRHLPRSPKPAYNSLLTLVRILEKKGHIAHRLEGKSHYYYPVLDSRRYRQSEIRRLVKGLFGGNALELAVSLVKNRELSSRDREELKRLLEEK